MMAKDVLDIAIDNIRSYIIYGYCAVIILNQDNIIYYYLHHDIVFFSLHHD